MDNILWEERIQDEAKRVERDQFIDNRAQQDPEWVQDIFRLTTYLSLYPLDMMEGHEEYIEQLLDAVMLYQGNFYDIEVLNALSHTPNFEQNDYAVLALYIYLACEVSRCQNLIPDDAGLLAILEDIDAEDKTLEDAEFGEDPRTILWAFRKASMMQKSGEIFTTSELSKRMHNALKLVGLDQRQDMNQLAWNWMFYGSFTVNGELNRYRFYGDPLPHLPIEKGGTFVDIVSTICGDHPFPRINDCISFVTGIKEKMAEYQDNPQAGHDFLKSISKDPAQINKYIVLGKQIKREAIKAKIQGFRDTLRPGDIKPISEKGRAFFHKLLSALPDEAWRFIRKSGISIIHTTDPTVNRLLPKGDKRGCLYGMSKEDSDRNRTCRALNQSNFGRMLLSEGYPRLLYPDEQAKLDADPTISVRQALLHETLHNVFQSKFVESTPALRERREELKSRVISVCRNLEGIDKTKYPFFSAWSFTLGYDISDILRSQPSNNATRDNPKVKKYFYPKKFWAEEVLANIYSMANTEFSKKFMRDKNPFHSCGRDVDEPELAEMRKLSADIVEFIRDVNKEMRKEKTGTTKHIDPKPPADPLADADLPPGSLIKAMARQTPAAATR